MGEYVAAGAVDLLHLGDLLTEIVGAGASAGAFDHGDVGGEAGEARELPPVHVGLERYLMGVIGTVAPAA